MEAEEKRKFDDLEVENAALRASIDKLERELREARNTASGGSANASELSA